MATNVVSHDIGQVLKQGRPDFQQRDAVQKIQLGLPTVQ
jgi:hypothetical protein